MSSSGSIPFKSKKRLLMDSPSSKPKTENRTPSSMALPTPEKPLENMLSRSRNRSVALSGKEIRQAAASSRRSEDPVASFAKSLPSFSHNDSSSSSSNLISSSETAEKEKLPEKYEILGNFFDALDSSIRLLKMRGEKLIFFNIFGKVEHLTDRRFCYNHLAQLKHILPEAIEVKRVLKDDETTYIKKPDLHVTINADAVEYNDKSKSESTNIAISKVFWARLAAFVKAHPQGDEVPEEPLPEPFNRPVKTASSPIKPTSSELNTVPTPCPVKLTSPEINIVPTPLKPFSTLASNVPLTPAIIDSTPPEFSPTPARLMGTARQQKRSSRYTNTDDVSTDPPAKHARRSLIQIFDSYPEDEKTMDFTNDEPIDQVPEEDVVFSDDEILSILPDKLRQSIKEQERKAIEGRNPAISLAKRRRKMIARLPKLFNVIHYLTQLQSRWVMTKEELVHKIIAGHTDITDRKEVEEQLTLLQELVPDWMSEKKSPSGDVITIHINSDSYAPTIRSRLEEENKQEMASLLS